MGGDRRKNNGDGPLVYFLISAVMGCILLYTHSVLPESAGGAEPRVATIDLTAKEDRNMNTGTTVKTWPGQGTRGNELTALILNWKTPRTLANTLKSYKRNGLFDYMKDTIIFFQEITKAQEDKAKENHPKITTIGDKKNVNIHWGMDYLINNSTTEYVLFLEKDWELVETYDKMVEQLEAGMALIDSGVADVVRFRSRLNPGPDFYAKEAFQNREDDVWNKQENLMCNFYHWIPRFAWRFPDKVTECWGKGDPSRPLFYCVKARFCNWTNNPVIFKKSWWNAHMAQYARKTPKEMKTWGSFEAELNSIPKSWNAAPWVVAMGDGLFAHHEIDG